MSLPNLPPGVRAETFTYSNGEKQTVYLAPFQSDGPHIRVEGGTRVLYYVYAAYVFRWPEGTSQLDVGHGSIAKHMGLHVGITITGAWGPSRLAEFGQQFAVREFARHAR